MPHIPLGAALRTQIHNQHARQLAYLKIDYEGAPDERQFPDYNQDTIVGWIKSNAAAIKAAKASQVTSPSADKPSWDSVLWSLVESAAVYLRKRESMIKAVNAARANDFNQALQYLKEAQEYVDEVADALDCDFIQLCDFAHQSPNGSWYHSGAYCGAFVSRESDNAIIGVAYKGTDNSREVVTDLDWDPSAGLVTGAAFGARIHSGFNKGLFGQFGDDNVRPFGA
ncbi:hypothetical protein BXZ70DRAFT_901532 [Cristinia sonorae]|uniref:Uncharacterized protein n=1 Tax=Cristinia sonorae TaxID=1940300 RepID=A0A8K0UF94_9AGAR|nr:hypothetical protein BXZ70DRAFT_901532 [Cristinia sonorae]